MSKSASLREFRVHLRTMASAYITVEAENEEDAIEAAFDQMPSLCAQCSGWGRAAGIEIGEWETSDQPWPALSGDVAVEATGE